MYRLLKPLGFRRKGRTFNRQTEEGVLQIIALQAGPYEIGPPLPKSVAHLRPDLYGKFTVNLGVFVQEVFERTNPGFLPRGVVSDAHCAIRTRLSHITSHVDTWWPLTNETETLVDEIGALLIDVGVPFLDRFGTRDQIVKRWVSFNENELRITLVARLDVAMVLLKRGDVEGARALFREHLAKPDILMNHAEYVRELSVRLGLGDLNQR